MEKIKFSEKITSEQVLGRIGEKKALLNNVLRRKSNWIGHIINRNGFLHNAIEGQMRQMRRVGKRTTQFLDNLRNRNRLEKKRGSWRSK